MHLPAVGLHNEVCDFPVQRIALLQQLLERAPRITFFQQRALPAFLCTYDLLVDRGVEIHDKSTPTEVAAGVCAHNCPTARGQHNAIEPCQIVDSSGLTL